ncbi:hypothetical protein ACFY1V_31595 [Streptomyces sp. NPDC001255]|uniref:hypothetical protein n=1 Tax=Streptomyces sp. NPDC001255 TaxID=3364550 RepID=UPI0036CAD757
MKRLLVLTAALAIPAAVLVRTAGPWRLMASRHGIWITPEARPSCPRCHGAGGWWDGDPSQPDMEACGCWADRRSLRIRLLPYRPEDAPF